MNDTIKLIQNHTSKRKYTEQKPDRETVNAIVRCAQMASTSSHFQAYTIIEVQDPAKREVLKECSGGQKWTVTAALAAQNAMTAAESMGMGGVVVGGIRNDVQKLIDTFQLPEKVAPLFALCLGYPAEAPDIKPRLPQEVIHKIDTYTEEGNDEMLAAYNAEVKAYYIERTGGKTDATWTEHCGKAMMAKTRDEVGVVFREHGLVKR